MSPDLRPISVVVPCRNASGWLDQALASVVDAAQREPAVEVVVVDNGSTDGTAEEVERRWGSQVTLLRAPRRTVGALRNLGAAHGGGTILSFVDADCAIAPGYFGIVRELLAETGAAAVGCYYELPPVPTALERAWDRLHAPSADGPATMINAGNLAVTRPA
ncbi:MAG: glycosyltransferase family A protein, partial [Gemmatimonadota bacterium]|nr:glycosyltransferase family A protein [Gemmatimonadota bacterium]